MQYIMHWPSMRVTIPMKLELAPNTQWCITDYPNTEEEMETYLTFLEKVFEHQRQELRERDPDLPSVAGNYKPTLKLPVWGREAYKGSAAHDEWMPVTPNDIPVIREVLTKERETTTTCIPEADNGI